MIRSIRYLFAAAALLGAGAALGDGFAGLSLRIRDESAPAGSIVQVKVDVTEPKPISTGKGKVKTKGISNLHGIALGSEDPQTYGVALVDGDELTFAIHSPTALFGTAADYPILTIAGVVDPDAHSGQTFPQTLDAGALQFLTPAGVQYPLELKNGTLTVANVITIGDVSPGETVVPAGGVVHISGVNFTPDTRIQLSESQVAETRYISSSRIDVVLARSTDMRGIRVRARSGNAESTYFAYQRTASSPSNDDLLRRAVPLFAPVTYTDATLRFPRPAPAKRRAAGPARGSGHQTYGFAVQNLNASAVTATVELLDFAGQPYAVNTLTIEPNQTVVREATEAFGLVVAPYGIRIRSSAPLHILGLTADRSSGGSVLPLPPS
ncbi:MAG: hypothetical protein JO197_02270 [Acidobacteria bacterium]|nr:hypothetical protein [Acidobacteriota bacterium]MBV9476794.1 hypothetical protein [Acidobacteriota bacterium]